MGGSEGLPWKLRQAFRGNALPLCALTFKQRDLQYMRSKPKKRITLIVSAQLKLGEVENF